MQHTGNVQSFSFRRKVSAIKRLLSALNANPSSRANKQVSTQLSVRSTLAYAKAYAS